MSIKLGGNKGAVKRTYSSRGLGGVSSATRTEGSSRSSVNPMNETGDRDTYEGSGTGYRKSLHDQLEALQATEVLRVAIEEVLERLKGHSRQLGHLTQKNEERFHVQEFQVALDELDALTRPELWEKTAVMRLFATLDSALIFPEGIAISDFTPTALKLVTLDWSHPDTSASTIDRIDAALMKLEQVEESTRSSRRVVDAALASIPHGKPSRIQQSNKINTIEFATQTAQWIRSAMLANGHQAIKVQAQRLSNQALHLVG